MPLWGRSSRGAQSAAFKPVELPPHATISSRAFERSPFAMADASFLSTPVLRGDELFGLRSLEWCFLPIRRAGDALKPAQIAKKLECA